MLRSGDFTAAEILSAPFALKSAKAEADAIKKDVASYESLRNEVKLHSGDAIDLKQYEPAMRHLIRSVWARLRYPSVTSLL